MSFNKPDLCPTNCLRADINDLFHLCEFLRISDWKKYPNMDNVLFKCNAVPNNQLLAQINNCNVIDEFFSLHFSK